jgi:hypothetical protein
MLAVESCAAGATSVCRSINVPGGQPMISTLSEDANRNLAVVVAQAREIAASQSFLASLEKAWPHVDHRADDESMQALTATDYVERLRSEIDGTVSFHCVPARPGSRMLAREGGELGLVGLNCQRAPILPFHNDLAEWRPYVATVVHEITHSVGFRHQGNTAAGNECSLPYLAGQIALNLALGSANWSNVACHAARNALLAP